MRSVWLFSWVLFSLVCFSFGTLLGHSLQLEEARQHYCSEEETQGTDLGEVVLAPPTAPEETPPETPVEENPTEKPKEILQIPEVISEEPDPEEAEIEDSPENRPRRGGGRR